MVFPFRARLGALLGVCGVGAAFLAGCGGGSRANPSPTGPFVIAERLSSSDFYDRDTNRYYDVYVCDAGGSDYGRVQMRSTSVDCYIYVYLKESNGRFTLIGENDDETSGTTDADFEFDVTRGRTYRIVATSSDTDERGSYDIRFSGDLNRPALLLPDANQRLQNLPLPAPIAKAKK